MIIIPQALLLAPVTSLTHSRIGYQTYTRGATFSSVSVSSETASGPKDAPLRPDTYEYWQASTLPATWTFDLGSAKEFDYVGIAGHDVGTSKVSVLIEYSSDGVVWETFSLEVLPADDSPIMFLDSATFARYVRATFTETGGGSVAPKIGVVYIGKALAMQRSIFVGHSPITMSRNTVLKAAKSRGGQFLSQNYRRSGVETEVAFRNLEGSWVRQYLDPFIRSARRFPYFFAWRPSAFPTEVGYVWTTEDIKPQNSGGGGRMQVSWSMNGVGNGD